MLWVHFLNCVMLAPLSLFLITYARNWPVGQGGWDVEGSDCILLPYKENLAILVWLLGFTSIPPLLPPIHRL